VRKDPVPQVAPVLPPPAEDHAAALAGIALSPNNDRALDEIDGAGLTPDDLPSPTGRVILAALDLYRAGLPVSLYTLPDRLTPETVAALGGSLALDRLVDHAPPPAHAGYHSRKLIEVGAKRRLGIQAAGWVEAAQNGTSVNDLMSAMRSALDAETARLPANRSGAFPAIISAATFMAEDIEAPPEVVRGVMHAGSKAVYGGPSKAVKTWTLMDLCLSVASGAPWLDFQTTAGRVLYVNFELQSFAVQRRLRAIGNARRLDVPANLHLWNLRGHACPLPRLLPELRRQIEGEGYVLIVLDPVYKTLAGRDENSAGDIGAVCNELEAVSVQTGATVAFGAHFTKGNASGKEAIDRISGSGVWARDPDSIIVATPHETEGAFTVEMTLRNFPPPAPFVVRWDFPLMRRDSELDPRRLRQPQRRAGSAPGRPDVAELVDGALALVKGNAVNVAHFRGKLHKLAGTQARVRELYNVLVGDGHLEELHARGRGRHDAWIGTPDQINELRQRTFHE